MANRHKLLFKLVTDIMETTDFAYEIECYNCDAWLHLAQNRSM